METQVNVSYVVMAHTARLEKAQDLCEQVKGSLIVDDGSKGENRNGDDAWAAGDPKSDWIVVLQDDAVLVDGFLDAVPEALSEAPETAVSLYVGTGRPMPRKVERAVALALMTGTSWLEHKTLLWGVGVAMPGSQVPNFLRWAPSCDLAYDSRIGAYWLRKGIPIRYTFPCLVDHRDEQTLLNHPWGRPTVPRKAWQLGIARSWNTGVVPI